MHSYLRGTPMKLWGKKLENQTEPITKWEEFKQWLRDSFKTPNQRILEATLALKDQRQRDDQNGRDLYVQDILRLASNPEDLVYLLTDDQAQQLYSFVCASKRNRCLAWWQLRFEYPMCD